MPDASDGHAGTLKPVSDVTRCCQYFELHPVWDGCQCLRSHGQSVSIRGLFVLKTHCLRDICDHLKQDSNLSTGNTSLLGFGQCSITTVAGIGHSHSVLAVPPILYLSDFPDWIDQPYEQVLVSQLNTMGPPGEHVCCFSETLPTRLNCLAGVGG